MLFFFFFFFGTRAALNKSLPITCSPSRSHTGNTSSVRGLFRQGCVNSSSQGCGVGYERGPAPVSPAALAGSSYCSALHLFRPGLGFYGYKSVVISSGELFSPGIRGQHSIASISTCQPPTRPPGPWTVVPRALLDPLCILTTRPPGSCAFAPTSILLLPVLMFLPVPLRQAQFKSLLFFYPSLVFLQFNSPLFLSFLCPSSLSIISQHSSFPPGHAAHTGQIGPAASAAPAAPAALPRCQPTVRSVPPSTQGFQFI